MTNYTTTIFDTEWFRTNGHHLVDLLADYMEQAKAGRDLPVLQWDEPDQQVEFWKSYSIVGDDLTPYFHEVLDRSIHLLHPGYV
ncbi:MAG: hypothetical protein JXA23_04005, partial [Bacteroidales bacterium]|nr:hypothetical protein [Bacteroidales bacterium]